MATRSPVVSRFARGGAIAFEFSGTIAGGAVLGWFADSKLGTEPWLLVTFTVLGAVGGFVRLIQMLRRFDRMDRAPER